MESAIVTDNLCEHLETCYTESNIRVAILDGIDGVSCEMPGGAFYAFPNISCTGIGAREMQDKLLNEADVNPGYLTSF